MMPSDRRKCRMYTTIEQTLMNLNTCYVHSASENLWRGSYHRSSWKRRVIIVNFFWLGKKSHFLCILSIRGKKLGLDSRQNMYATYFPHAQFLRSKRLLNGSNFISRLAKITIRRFTSTIYNLVWMLQFWLHKKDAWYILKFYWRFHLLTYNLAKIFLKYF